MARHRILGALTIVTALLSYPCLAAAGQSYQNKQKITSQSIEFDEEYLQKMQYQGHDMVIGGALLIPVGVILSAVTGSLAFFRGVGHAFCDEGTCEETDSFRRSQTALIVFGCLGIFGVVPAGIVMICVGKLKINRAKKLMAAKDRALVPAIAVAPTPSFDGAVASLTWRF